MIAGEPSGDLHGYHLLKHFPSSLKIGGVAGPKMRQLPFETVMEMEHFQVMGFMDVLQALPQLIRRFYSLKKTILKRRPSVVVTIDYPEFNLRLAASLRKAGYQGKICHYISPSVWAWRKERISLMAKTFDLLLTILPFEKAYFEHSGLPVKYVGHPLVQEIPFQEHPKDENLLALFPGSRKKEIERVLPFYQSLIPQLKRVYPQLRCVVSCANPQLAPLLEGDFEVTQDTAFLMQHAHAAIAKSGTVSLELCLYQVPTVVIYPVSSIDAFIAKKIFRISLPHYSLPNLIAGKTVFPELIGPALSEKNLYEETLNLLSRPEERKKCLDQCSFIRNRLGSEDASVNTSKEILTLLG